MHIAPAIFRTSPKIIDNLPLDLKWNERLAQSMAVLQLHACYQQLSIDGNCFILWHEFTSLTVSFSGILGPFYELKKSINPFQ